LIATTALASTALLAVPGYAQDQVNLTWQMWGDEADSALFSSLAALVTEEYPNITVTPQFSGWTDYWTRLPVLAASGQIADLVAMQSMRMPTFYGILEPLDPYFEKEGFDLSQYESSIIAGLSHGGTHYALPYDVGPWVVFYNIDRFEEAGIPAPAPDWTFDQFRDAAVKLTGDGKYGYATQAFDYIAGPVALGAEYLNDADEFEANNPGYVEAVGKYVDLVNVDKASPVFASGAGAITGSGRFATGEAAMYIDGPWVLISTKDAVDFKIGVAPLPRGDGPSRFITAGSGWGVAAASQHKDEAFKALTVLTGPKAAEILAKAGRALPGRLDAQKFWYEEAAKDVVGASEALSYSFDHSTTFRLNDKYNDFENLITQYMPLALQGDDDGIRSDRHPEPAAVLACSPLGSAGAVLPGRYRQKGWSHDSNSRQCGAGCRASQTKEEPVDCS
jgi:ABC-type glycerol-3-phosphate transport system substrate-binding protein